MAKVIIQLAVMPQTPSLCHLCSCLCDSKVSGTDTEKETTWHSLSKTPGSTSGVQGGSARASVQGRAWGGLRWVSTGTIIGVRSEAGSVAGSWFED